MASLGAAQDSEAPAAAARQRIARAGIDLFLAQGYERTTVEAIAERAGVARRTFFRYFRTKDDVVFSDHELLARSVAAHLEAQDDATPLRAVCSGARVVFRSYLDDPVVSVQRYELIRSVPALRDREITWVSQYVRVFSDYLRGRLDGEPEATRTADVAAAAIVAAHNHVLREWLRGGALTDPFPALDEAFAWVLARFEAGPLSDAAVVAVFRSQDPVDDVVQRISRSL
jgi:AcrR family transcriptional regulator